MTDTLEARTIINLGQQVARERTRRERAEQQVRDVRAIVRTIERECLCTLEHECVSCRLDAALMGRDALTPSEPRR